MAQSRTHGLVTTFPEIAQTAIPQQAYIKHIKLNDWLSSITELDTYSLYIDLFMVAADIILSIYKL